MVAQQHVHGPEDHNLNIHCHGKLRTQALFLYPSPRVRFDTYKARVKITIVYVSMFRLEIYVG
jgi:hypothetical protein